MSKPYALHSFVKNTQQVLAGFAIDTELLQQLTPQATITLGKILGSFEQLIMLTAPPAIDNPAPDNIAIAKGE